jgi:putative endonuclease
MAKHYYVYIMTNPANTVLYTGVTNNLERRVFEHKNKTHRGFAEKYNAGKLVFYETYSDIRLAIAREKQIKNWKRAWKISLIEQGNVQWLDLSAGWRC